MLPNRRSWLLFLSTVYLIVPAAASLSRSPQDIAMKRGASAISQSAETLAMKSSLLEKIRSVVVAGGTHGNEYTGVWCIRALEEQKKVLKARYPSLSIDTILANPEAHANNQRFVDSDLNREFTSEKLQGKESNSVEAKQAQFLNERLGPKDDPKTDVVVDLHSSTTNMGITLIVPEGDEVMTLAAAYVAHQCQKKVKCGIHIVVHPYPDRNLRPSLSSCGKCGFTIEVGPVPQGVLRHDAVQHTQAALHEFLKFLHEYNTMGLSQMQQQVLEWHDDSPKIPCWRSAPAIREGEMSGKIPWPKMVGNFPLVLIHESLQDQDFIKPLNKGDPLFVELDGSIIPYNGSHGDSVHLMFINEGGYYYASSGAGISLVIPAFYDLKSGKFIVEDETATMQ